MRERIKRSSLNLIEAKTKEDRRTVETTNPCELARQRFIELRSDPLFTRFEKYPQRRKRERSLCLLRKDGDVQSQNLCSDQERKTMHKWLDAILDDAGSAETIKIIQAALDGENFLIRWKKEIKSTQSKLNEFWITFMLKTEKFYPSNREWP